MAGMSLGRSAYAKRSLLKFLSSSRSVHKGALVGFAVFLLLGCLWLEPGEEVMGGRRRPGKGAGEGKGKGGRERGQPGGLSGGCRALKA